MTGFMMFVAVILNLSTVLFHLIQLHYMNYILIIIIKIIFYINRALFKEITQPFKNTIHNKNITRRQSV